MKRARKLDRAVDDDLLTEWDTEFWHVRPLSAALASSQPRRALWTIAVTRTTRSSQSAKTTHATVESGIASPCSHMKKTPTDKSRAGIGFRG